MVLTKRHREPCHGLHGRASHLMCCFGFFALSSIRIIYRVFVLNFLIALICAHQRVVFVAVCSSVLCKTVPEACLTKFDFLGVFVFRSHRRSATDLIDRPFLQAAMNCWVSIGFVFVLLAQAFAPSSGTFVTYTPPNDGVTYPSACATHTDGNIW